MKNYYIALGTLLALTFAVPSHARTKASAAPATTRSTASGDTAHTRVGVGFATYGGAGGAGVAAPALSVWWDLASVHSLQFTGAIGSSNPFTFGVGAAYRYTAMGTQETGFHVGLGINLGTALAAGGGGGAATAFFLNIVPGGGFHFSLGGAVSNISLSFDGGVILAVTPGFQLAMGPLGTFGGGAIHYFF